MMVFDVSNLVFTATSGVAPIPVASAATGTYSWDAATSTGAWDISVPYTLPYGPFDLGGLLSITTVSNGQILAQAASTSFQSTYTINDLAQQGNFSMTFATSLDAGTNSAVSGAFDVQSDCSCGPYHIIGTIGGYLTPATVAPVPLPSPFILLFTGLLVMMAVATKRHQMLAAFKP